MNIGPSGWCEGNENVPPKLLKNSKFGGTFRCYIFIYYIDFQCDIISIQRFFHSVHGVCLGLFGDVDVVLHRDAEDLVDEPSVFEPDVQAGNPR